MAAVLLGIGAGPNVGQEACIAPDAMVRLWSVPIVTAQMDDVSQRLTTELGFTPVPLATDDYPLVASEIAFADGSGLKLVGELGADQTMTSIEDPVRAWDDPTGPVRDWMTDRYRGLLLDGGGGAFLGLATADIAGVTSVIREIEPEIVQSPGHPRGQLLFPPGHFLQALFFQSVEPIDVPESSDSPDAGPHSLRAAWVMVEDPDRLTDLLVALGGRDCGVSRHPEHLHGRAVGIRGGTVYVVDSGVWMADPGSAPVVSLTVEVGPDRPAHNVVLGPAGGLWIELRSQSVPP